MSAEAMITEEDKPSVDSILFCQIVLDIIKYVHQNSTQKPCYMEQYFI